MVIAIDATSTSIPGTSATNKWQHIVGTGDNRYLSVHIMAARSFSTVHAGTVQWIIAGAGGTQTASIIRHDDGASSQESELWGLVAPASGTGTINVVMSANLSQGFAMGGASYTGVDQLTPVEGSAGLAGTNGTALGTITTVNNNAWVIDTTSWNDASHALTPLSGQTKFLNGTTANTDLAVASYRGPVSPAGATVQGYSSNFSILYSMSLASLKPSGGAGTNLIQSTGTAVLGLGSTSVTWGANTTNGNLIVVGITLTNATTLGTVSSVVDSQSNTYVKAITGTKSSTLVSVIDEEIWYAANITGGAGSVTVNHTVDNCAIFAREYSGFNTFDVAGSATGSSTTPNSGTSATTNFATELVIVSTGDDKGSGQTYTAAGNYADMVGTTTTLTGVSMEDNIVLSTGVQTGTLTFGSSADWVSLLATFYKAQANKFLSKLALLGVG